MLSYTVGVPKEQKLGRRARNEANFLCSFRHLYLLNLKIRITMSYWIEVKYV